MPRAWLDASWSAPPGVRGLTTLRHGLGHSAPPFDHCNLGTRSGDDAATVAANRAALIAALRLPSPPRWLRQVHGTGVMRMTAGDATSASEPEADAAITADAGVVLAILSADCLPVLLATADGSRIGAAHAGWRGLAAGVLENTVAALEVAPETLLAWLGPAAGPRAYEVGVEVRDAFVGTDPGAAAAFAPTRPGHWRCDLYALARRRLAALGVMRIAGGDQCTISAPQRYFSHRRDARTGRMVSLLWME